MSAQDLLSIAAPDPSTAYVTSNKGILKTTDGGATWQSVYFNPSLLSIFSVSAPNSSTVWALGSNFGATSNVVLRSLNGGATWENVTCGPCAGLPPKSIEARSANLAYLALGQYSGGKSSGLMLKTTDGGSSWSVQLNLTTTDNVYPWPILALSDTTAVSALYNSGLAKFMYTSDGGATWTQSPAQAASYMRGLAAYNSSIVVAAGGGSISSNLSYIVRSTDGGQSWQATTNSTESAFSLQGVCVQAATGDGWAVGGSFGAGGIRRSLPSSAGASWTTPANDTAWSGATLQACAAPAANLVYVVGSSGVIATSRDQGASWTRQVCKWTSGGFGSCD